MPTLPTVDLPDRIQKLLAERQHHSDAVTRIDEILGGVNAALKGASLASPNGQKSVATAAPAPAPAPAGKPKKRRRGRGHFPLSAEESILAFVKQMRSPTTAQINEHLQAEGRSSSANNALGKLFREKKLKRTAIEGQRGSRYSVA
jgi:hypothetical protein